MIEDPFLSFFRKHLLILTLSSPRPFPLIRLLANGYSLESIANATLEADNISKERILSANKQHLDKINEVSERFGRVIKKALFIPNKKPLVQSTVAANSA